MLTLGRSSWMVTDLPEGTDEIVLRVSRRGDAVEVRYVIEDGPAELAALVFMPPGREVLAGVMAAAPEGSGFRVTFHDLRITEPDWSGTAERDPSSPDDQAGWTGDEQPAWRATDGEPGWRAGKVVLESHLLFEVGEDALDHESGRSERPLSADVGGGARLVGGEQRRAGGGEPGLVVPAPEALVADHDLGRGAGEQVGERLVLLLVCRDDRVAERQPALVGQQHQPHAPDVAVR